MSLFDMIQSRSVRDFDNYATRIVGKYEVTILDRRLLFAYP